MVTRGKIRGQGRQLADYLLRQGENDNIRVLQIKGTSQNADLRKSLVEMSLTTELSGRTKKGLYQVVVNPAPTESYCMTDQDWIRAAEILEAETGFTGQPRAIVLHEKENRIHAHIVFQRYSFERGKMITNRFSRFAQNRARQTMEKEFGHLRTSQFNLDRPALRKTLAFLWQEARSGEEFISLASKNGLTIAQGDDRPFAVITPGGIAFDLVRETKGVKTKQFREKFKGIRLPTKKTVLRNISRKRKTRQTESDRERMTKELKQQLQRDPMKDKSRGR
ncbi:relaxase/mobilization nuclease domain-containing protein [Flavitalea sp. BT771]|uniref:relaxase/mobilization nuclease domain-containing protein n=1 Tax=Flavitalea sp. BT771 TaxID=3063329 RepID=UPI0026E2EC74|nr:relaxase/mobilization nuclease domain-containing protein [Flavitalea sp. BT771]MDO6430917.1 relaxase/mobilization nuclease domain-containing protein [Flavitalea sp. BT771]MDV6218943.1 relaxase/mobilization nuclease domain-containing protein [Flavitalea sp. BT771]